MTTDDTDLDSLFALARDSRTVAPDTLTNRILADALASLPRAPELQVVHRPQRHALFGLGWLQVTGLTAVGALGVVLGVLNPGFGSDLSSDAYSLADLMPGLQDVLSEEGEG
jgi:hypothetical protein